MHAGGVPHIHCVLARENSVEFKDGFKKFLSQQPSMMEAGCRRSLEHVHSWSLSSAMAVGICLLNVNIVGHGLRHLAMNMPCFLVFHSSAKHGGHPFAWQAMVMSPGVELEERHRTKRGEKAVCQAEARARAKSS